MRLAVPVNPDDSAGVRDHPNSVSRPFGWQYLSQLGNTEVAINTKMLQRCPHFQTPSVRLPPGVEGTVVGKSLLMTDVQLRSFEIRKPWRDLTATDHGPEAREAWLNEAATPLWTNPQS